MEPTSSFEIERKYDLDPGASVPDFLSVGRVASADQPTTATLRAVYYDTADFTLARNHTVVRRRSGGVDEGWHIKFPKTGTPGAGDGRRELHWPIGLSTDSVPEPVIAVLAELVGSQPLNPIATLDNTRTTHYLRNAAGEIIAELCEDSVIGTALATGVETVWSEWEVELHPAAGGTAQSADELLDEIESLVVRAGARPATSVSKLARVLGAESLPG